jgi:hypothetical protein
LTELFLDYTFEPSDFLRLRLLVQVNGVDMLLDCCDSSIVSVLAVLELLLKINDLLLDLLEAELFLLGDVLYLSRQLIQDLILVVELHLQLLNLELCREVLSILFVGCLELLDLLLRLLVESHLLMVNEKVLLGVMLKP